MFKRESSEFGKHFSMGKIDEIMESHDEQVRSVWIKYKLNSEKNTEDALTSLFK